jgi:hypothetical protein
MKRIAFGCCCGAGADVDVGRSGSTFGSIFSGFDFDSFGNLGKAAVSIVSANLKGIHFRRFVGGPDRAAASSEHTHTSAAAYEQAVLNSSLFPAT